MTDTVGRRWYQRTRLWVVIALLAIPVSLGFLILNLSIWDRNLVVALLGLASLVLVPIGLWMGALVAKHAWARLLLVLSTVLLSLVAVFSVFVFWDGQEDEAFDGCLFVETADGGTVQQDADLCAYLEDGSLQRERNLSYAMLGVFWTGPLVALYVFRRRFQPDDRQEG